MRKWLARLLLQPEIADAKSVYGMVSRQLDLADERVDRNYGNERNGELIGMNFVLTTIGVEVKPKPQRVVLPSPTNLNPPVDREFYIRHYRSLAEQRERQRKRAEAAEQALDAATREAAEYRRELERRQLWQHNFITLDVLNSHPSGHGKVLMERKDQAERDLNEALRLLSQAAGYIMHPEGWGSTSNLMRDILKLFQRHDSKEGLWSRHYAKLIVTKDELNEQEDFGVR